MKGKGGAHPPPPPPIRHWGADRAKHPRDGGLANVLSSVKSQLYCNLAQVGLV